jgi:putative Mg2+ transporter-C (MgtC) family protein
VPTDLALQGDLALRMVLAAVLGAGIGLEREIHDHPAGMRTHLLVSLGTAIFTVLSIYGFSGIVVGGVAATVDPSRIAAQVVSGIGFLGAGAILKYGTSIRGLTTAASLWTTAAIGMAAGAGQWAIAVVGSIIALVSLWPLNALEMRVHRPGTSAVRVRLEMTRLEALGEVSRALAERRIEMAAINTQRAGKDRYEVELTLRFAPGVRSEDAVAAITSIPDVEVVETATGGE